MRWIDEAWNNLNSEVDTSVCVCEEPKVIYFPGDETYTCGNCFKDLKENID